MGKFMKVFIFLTISTTLVTASPKDSTKHLVGYWQISQGSMMEQDRGQNPQIIVKIGITASKGTLFDVTLVDGPDTMTFENVAFRCQNNHVCAAYVTKDHYTLLMLKMVSQDEFMLIKCIDILSDQKRPKLRSILKEGANFIRISKERF